MKKINELKKFLYENNITLKTLAEKVCKIDSTIPKYGKGAYSYWINGKRKWPGNVAFAVSRVINCEISAECLIKRDYIKDNRLDR